MWHSLTGRGFWTQENVSQAGRNAVRALTSLVVGRVSLSHEAIQWLISQNFR
jgi:hypothetical protein